MQARPAAPTSPGMAAIPDTRGPAARAALAPLLAALALTASPVPLGASDFEPGDVFVGVGFGVYQRYDRAGVYLESVDMLAGGLTAPLLGRIILP